MCAPSCAVLRQHFRSCDREDGEQVIARKAHPSGPGGRSATAGVALKAAVAVLHSVLDADALPESLVVPPSALFTAKAKADLWHAIARGEEPACEVRCNRLPCSLPLTLTSRHQLWE